MAAPAYIIKEYSEAVDKNILVSVGIGTGKEPVEPSDEDLDMRKYSDDELGKAASDNLQKTIQLATHSTVVNETLRLQRDFILNCKSDRQDILLSCFRGLYHKKHDITFFGVDSSAHNEQGD